MNKTTLALAAISALSFTAPAQAVIINYSVSGPATGTFALDLNAGVYTFSAADILVGSNHFTNANTSLISFSTTYYLGGTLNGANGLSDGTNDFFIIFDPTLISQSATFAFTTNPIGPKVPAPNVQVTQLAAAVPEPASWAMMLIGFGAIGLTLRRRKPAPALA